MIHQNIGISASVTSIMELGCKFLLCVPALHAEFHIILYYTLSLNLARGHNLKLAW